MADLNYAKAYGSALAESFPSSLHFGALYATPNNGRYRFTGGKTVEIPTLAVGGRVDVDRDGIDTVTRNFDNAWEEKTLSNQRCWSTLVHPRDIDETDLAASVANITSVYNNEQKFPEMDAYTVSKLYSSWVAAGKTATTAAITAQNVLTVFDTMMQQMSEKLVPATGRVLYVTPAVMTALKTVEGLTRTLSLHSGETGLNRAVTVLDGVAVVEVPSSLMKTKYVFSEGWTPDAAAKQIHMLLVHPEAVITPVSYRFARLDPPSALSGGKYVYYEESFEDVFILNKKLDGIAFVIDA
jgi:hypothetical protein